jgi:hypothetical protein
MSLVNILYFQVLYFLHSILFLSFHARRSEVISSNTVLDGLLTYQAVNLLRSSWSGDCIRVLIYPLVYGHAINFLHKYDK